MRPASTKSTRSARASGRAGRCSEIDDGALEPLHDVEEALGGVRVELRGRLVEQQQARAQRERRGQADPLQLTAGQLGRRAVGELLGADERERLLDPRPDLGRAATAVFSRPKATSFATRIITIWSSGSWNTDATCPASWAGVASRVSRPQTTTRPEKVPPWKCGTRPASARTSVDLPEPDGPSSDDVLAFGELERDAVERDVRRRRRRSGGCRRRLQPQRPHGDQGDRRRRARRGRGCATAAGARACAGRSRSRAPPSPRRG